MCIYWAELWRLSSEFGHNITGNGTSKPIFMFSVPPHVSPQITRERAFKVALVAFLWRFFTVHFQMCPKNTCLRRCIVTLVTYIWLAFLQCVFSNVFSDHLPEKMHKGCPPEKKRYNVGIIPTLPSSQSWPFLEFVREAMIGCLATWELFPRFIVFFSGGHP